MKDQLKGVSRRQFIGTAAAAATLTALNWRSLAFGKPNDQIAVGFIGVGGHGLGRLRQFLRQSDVRVAAICDVDRRHLDRAIAEVEKAQGHKPKGFGDFRLLLEDREIDAVAVITPDHWHSIPTVRACEAGKDVFVEKPLSYSIAEGRAMADASLKHQRVTQMGNHIHNDLPNYRRVVELVQSNRLGRITRVHCWKTSQVQPFTPTQPAVQPAELDYDFWLGPAPQRPYHPLRSHFHYRQFWDYSGGNVIDFWCHIVDVAVWALKLQAPHSVSAVGRRFFLTDETEMPDSMEAVLEFPEAVLTFSYRPTPLPNFEHMGGIGCLFEGTEASLVTNYNQHEVWVKGKRVDDFPRPEPSIPNSPGHIREFLDAIKSRTLETTCNLRYGHQLTKLGLLANIAFRVGRRLYWDDRRERMIDDNYATRFLSRQFRKPYKF